jgi:hypothetical protein
VSVRPKAPTPPLTELILRAGDITGSWDVDQHVSDVVRGDSGAAVVAIWGEGARDACRVGFCVDGVEYDDVKDCDDTTGAVVSELLGSDLGVSDVELEDVFTTEPGDIPAGEPVCLMSWEVDAILGESRFRGLLTLSTPIPAMIELTNVRVARVDVALTVLWLVVKASVRGSTLSKPDMATITAAAFAERPLTPSKPRPGLRVTAATPRLTVLTRLDMALPYSAIQ